MGGGCCLIRRHTGTPPSSRLNVHRKQRNAVLLYALAKTPRRRSGLVGPLTEDSSTSPLLMRIALARFGNVRRKAEMLSKLPVPALMGPRSLETASGFITPS